MTNDFTQKAAEMMGQFQALAPKITHAAVQAVQVSAISNLVWGVWGLVVLAIAAWYWKKFYVWVFVDDFDEFEDEGKAALACGVLLLVTVVSFCCAYQAFDPWNWVAIWRPDLYIAHTVLGGL